MGKMRLSSITIKGMHNIDNKTYDLKNFNYLNGLNGAGKTTIMQAIQFALLGYIPGTDKRKEAIFRHAGEPEMTVTLNIDDGGPGIQIIRKYIKTSKDIVTTCDVTPVGFALQDIMQGLELPVCNFDEFVGMTSNKLKDWFMWFLPASDDPIVWNKVLDDAIVDYGKILHPEFVKEIKDSAAKLPEGLEGIRQFNEQLKSVLSFKKGEATRVQSTIQSLIFYDDCDEGLNSDSLKQDIAAAILKRDELKRQQLLSSQNAQIKKDIEALGLPANLIEADKGYAELTSRLQSLSSKSDEEPDVSKYQQIITTCNEKITAKKVDQQNKRFMINERQKVIDGKGVCPYTNGTCVEISKLVDEYALEVAELTKEISEIDAELIKINADMSKAQGQITSIQTEFNNARRIREQELQQVNQDIRIIEQSYTKLISLQSRLTSVSSDMTDVEFIIHIQTLEGDMQSKQELIAKIEANKRYNELTDTLTKEKYQTEQDIEILKDWIKLTDVNGLQSKVMDKPFEGLADKMTTYLKKFFVDDSIKAKFYLSEKANSFSFGIFRDNIYISFDQLSGGEQCLYTLALLTSIVDTDDINMPLVLVDDLLDHLDRPRIDALFEALYGLDSVQIILAGVQECKHENASEFVIEVSR